MYALCGQGMACDEFAGQYDPAGQGTIIAGLAHRLPASQLDGVDEPAGQYFPEKHHALMNLLH